jgi:hypothetical protein
MLVTETGFKHKYGWISVSSSFGGNKQKEMLFYGLYQFHLHRYKMQFWLVIVFRMSS